VETQLFCHEMRRVVVLFSDTLDAISLNAISVYIGSNVYSLYGVVG